MVRPLQSLLAVALRRSHGGGVLGGLDADGPAIQRPDHGSHYLVLAHGVGAGMDTPFMAVYAEGLAPAGFRVARLEFSYTAQRRRTGKQRPPDREPVLRETWLAVIEQLGAKNLVIGGESLGGRVASLAMRPARCGWSASNIIPSRRQAGATPC